jgi:DNA-binding NarL/FixJ family response regulator
MSGETPKRNEPRHTLTAWLVDDSQAVRELLPGLLGEGHDIRFERVFAAPTQALAAVREGTPPDVILLDVNLRQECGIDYVRPIREHAPGTRVLMITTFYDSHRESEAAAEGASGFILKTSSVEDMARIIHESPQVEPQPEMVFAKENFSQTGIVEIARSEPAVRGFRPPTGHALDTGMKLLTRCWQGATTRAARLGVHF